MRGKELKALFDAYDEEYCKFDRISEKLSSRRDLHAMILLDKLVPEGCRMISAVAHDELFFGISLEELAAVVTEAQVLELIRCGVRISEDSLAFFV